MRIPCLLLLCCAAVLISCTPPKPPKVTVGPQSAEAFKEQIENVLDQNNQIHELFYGRPLIDYDRMTVESSGDGSFKVTLENPSLSDPVLKLEGLPGSRLTLRMTPLSEDSLRLEAQAPEGRAKLKDTLDAEGLLLTFKEPKVDLVVHLPSFSIMEGTLSSGPMQGEGILGTGSSSLDSLHVTFGSQSRSTGEGRSVQMNAEFENLELNGSDGWEIQSDRLLITSLSPVQSLREKQRFAEIVTRRAEAYWSPTEADNILSDELEQQFISWNRPAILSFTLEGADLREQASHIEVARLSTTFRRQPLSGRAAEIAFEFELEKAQNVKGGDLFGPADGSFDGLDFLKVHAKHGPLEIALFDYQLANLLDYLRSDENAERERSHYLTHEATFAARRAGFQFTEIELLAGDLLVSAEGAIAFEFLDADRGFPGPAAPVADFDVQVADLSALNRVAQRALKIDADRIERLGKGILAALDARQDRPQEDGFTGPYSLKLSKFGTWTLNGIPFDPADR